MDPKTNPFAAAATLAYDSWRKAMEDQLARVVAVQARVREAEAAGAALVRAALDDSARLLEESLAWTSSVFAATRTHDHGPRGEAGPPKG